MKIIENLNLNFTLSDNGVKRCFDYREALMNKHGKNHVPMGKYLHIIFNQIKDNELDFLISELGVELPNDFIRLLKLYNGLILYSGTLAIYGFGRELMNGNLQVNRNPNYEFPYHLTDYNQNITNNKQLIIGSFDDMRLVYKLKDTENNVYLIDSKDKILNSWRNLDEAISYLLDKLTNLYDQNGIVKNPKIIGKYIFNRPSKI